MRAVAVSRRSVAVRRAFMDWSQQLPKSRMIERTTSFGRRLAGIVSREDKYCVGNV